MSVFNENIKYVHVERLGYKDMCADQVTKSSSDARLGADLLSGGRSKGKTSPDVVLAAPIDQSSQPVRKVAMKLHWALFGKLLASGIIPGLGYIVVVGINKLYVLYCNWGIVESGAQDAANTHTQTPSLSAGRPEVLKGSRLLNPGKTVGDTHNRVAEKAHSGSLNLVNKLEQVLDVPDSRKPTRTIQGYFDYTKIDSFIWSGSFGKEKFIIYPKEHDWKSTLNEGPYRAYLQSVFTQMKKAGMGQVDLDFTQISSIDALFTGDYSHVPGSDVFIAVLKNEQFLGMDGKPIDMLKLYIDEAHKAGMKVDLSFGGQNAGGVKICGAEETAKGQADKLVDFMNRYEIDSVDFDLEESAAISFAVENTPEEQQEFFQELHNKLSPKGKTVLLTLEGSTKWASVLKHLFYDDQKQPVFGDRFDGLNLMLYSQTQYYIDADNQDWGVEEWMDIIGKENAGKIHIGFEDHVPYENPSASAGQPYQITTKNRGQAAAEVYRQLLEKLQKNGYPSDLGGPFWWPDERDDNYKPNQSDSVFSQVMVDFYKYLQEKS